MVDAKEGMPDIEFFQSFIQNKEEKEFQSGLSGLGGSYNTVEAITGWFLKFFGYIDWGGNEKYTKFEAEELRVKDFDKLPKQMLIAPFQVILSSGNCNLVYKVGFLGCGKNENHEIYPMVGWMVSQATEKDLNSVL